MYRIMALEGAQLLLTPADFTMPTGKDHWETILRTRAIENGCYVIAPAQYGVKPNFQAYANSVVIDPWGNVIARASNRPQVITAEIDLDYLAQGPQADFYFGEPPTRCIQPGKKGLVKNGGRVRIDQGPVR